MKVAEGWISRRTFVGRLSACGLLSGCRQGDFAASESGACLRVGVLSDIHIQCGCDEVSCHGLWWKTTRFLEEALRWFRTQKADVVVIAGDLTDQGLLEQLQSVADAWYRVFPDDRRLDGCRVEKVFVTGNHDWDGWHYDDLCERRFPTSKERASQILQRDYMKFWEQTFHEPYAPIYMKQVKGYWFVGSHWDGSRGDPVSDYARIEQFLRTHADKMVQSRPFFYVQHPHPKDTCYGPWAWGHDKGTVTRCLSEFPNAIAISGHSHYSLTDERSVWQGAFTSLGAASLSFAGIPYDDRPGEGYENSRAGGCGAWRIDAQKLMPSYSVGPVLDGNLFGDSRQGMLLTVFADSIVIRRRDFACALDLGCDWVLPLPVVAERPYAFPTRRKTLRAPEFAANAVLKVERTQARCRGGCSDDGGEVLPSTVVDACRLHIPPANAATGRVKCYEIVLQEGMRHLSKQVLAEGFHLPAEHLRARSETICVLGPIGDGLVTLTVTPMGWFGARGKSLTAKLKGCVSNERC